MIPHRGSCVYTSCYCEENVLLLLESAGLDISFALFVSNTNRTVAFWGHSKDVIVWDYHVVALFSFANGLWVCDADAKDLPWPCPLEKWLSSSFREREVKSKFHPQFRLVPAAVYSREFCSDRSHMKDSGKDSPSYPARFRTDCATNLFPMFVNMDPRAGFGVVCENQVRLRESLYERAYEDLQIVVRNATLEDMADLFDLERAEGWSAPDSSQGFVYFHLDRTGWLKAVQGKRSVGFISILKYQGWAYLSSFIVAKDCRGKRFGEALWRSAIERIPKGMPVVLDAVQFQGTVDGEFVDMVPTYAKDVDHFRFAPLFTWYNFFLEPFVPRVEERVLPPGVTIERAQKHHMEAIHALHVRGMGADLGVTFLDEWRTLPGSAMLVASSLKHGVVGVIAARPMANGSYKMGPFFLEPEYASLANLVDGLCDELAIALGGHVPKMAVFVALDSNPWAKAWLERGGWKASNRNCVRMVRWGSSQGGEKGKYGPVLGADMRMVFAVTSLKLG